VAVAGLNKQSMSGCREGSRMSVHCGATVWTPASSVQPGDIPDGCSGT